MDKHQRLMNPVLIAGCVIIMTGFAIRASFGVFQIPIADEFGWLRADFSLAIGLSILAAVLCYAASRAGREDVNG